MDDTRLPGQKGRFVSQRALMAPRLLCTIGVSDTCVKAVYVRLTQDGSDVGNDDAGTSNITVADETGMVVSMTTTIGLNWGSHIMVPEFGFVLNDSMDDFSVQGQTNGTGYPAQQANFGKLITSLQALHN
jgi:gamma-glutamyltranspeptidase